jgi:hypothetical protein
VGPRRFGEVTILDPTGTTLLCKVNNELACGRKATPPSGTYSPGRDSNLTSPEEKPECSPLEAHI